MKKKEREVLQKKALKLFLQGESKYKIAKILKVAEKTVHTWAKKKNWNELYKQTEQKFTEKLQDTVSDERERSLRLIKGAEALIAQKIQSGEIEGITIGALSQLQRAKWEILMPKTISQYNFMKQDNNINILNKLTPEETTKLYEVLVEEKDDTTK